jgi:SNF2 family DNA or RNA helicase
MSPNSPPNSDHSKVRIDYDERTSRYIIVSPPWMVDQIRQIPNRRWDAKRKLWTAPALRANSVFILEKFANAVLTPKAKDALNVSVEKSEVKRTKFPVNYAFKTKPREYQRKALDKAWAQPYFAFYMDMGTGKTKTSLDLFSAYFLNGDVDRLLIITKFSTRRNWEREIGIHCPVECDVRILDTTKAKDFDEWNTTRDDRLKVLIVGTESLAIGKAPEFSERFVSVSARVGVVIDEAHMIKNHSAQRSKTCARLGLSASRKLIMTGTPVANGPMDVFMQFEFLDPNIIGIGDFYSFRNRYAIMGGYEDKQVVGYQNMPELIELLAPFVYQVRKADVLTELPPKVYEVREVALTEEQKRLYKEIAKKNKAVTGDKGVMVKSVLERMLRLQEIAGGVITYDRQPDLYNPSKFDHCRIIGSNPKIDELLSIVEETQCATIVWCRFLEEIAMVSEALRAKYGRDSVVEIHGGVSEADRDRNVSEIFQKNAARFLVGNAATGGVGLNMTAAELVIYYSNSFSFTDREQSEDRAHRIGQTKSVTYIDLVAEGTVDQVVVQALKSKKDVSEFVRTSIDSMDTINVDHLFGTVA